MQGGETDDDRTHGDAHRDLNRSALSECELVPAIAHGRHEWSWLPVRVGLSLGCYRVGGVGAMFRGFAIRSPLRHSNQLASLKTVANVAPTRAKTTTSMASISRRLMGPDRMLGEYHVGVSRSALPVDAVERAIEQSPPDGMKEAAQLALETALQTASINPAGYEVIVHDDELVGPMVFVVLPDGSSCPLPALEAKLTAP